MNKESQFPFTIAPESSDERFMLEALRLAWNAYQKKEVPIGAVLVSEGRVVSRGYNQVELLQDATAHAEMLAITAGAVAFGNWRLLNTTLYTTVEPCVMCAGAAFLARVERIVWGAKDLRHGANGSWVDLFKTVHPTHKIEIVGGVLEEPSAHLMRQFFRERRDEK